MQISDSNALLVAGPSLNQQCRVGSLTYFLGEERRRRLCTWKNRVDGDFEEWSQCPVLQATLRYLAFAGPHTHKVRWQEKLEKLETSEGRFLDFLTDPMNASWVILPPQHPVAAASTNRLQALTQIFDHLAEPRAADCMHAADMPV